MSSFTDYLGLNKHKLFENLRETLPSEIIKTQNVLTVNDGVLFTWDFQDHCVLTLNVKEARCREDGGVPHQGGFNTMLEKFEGCPGISTKVRMFIVPQNFNRGQQLLSMNFSTPYPLRDNIVVKLLLEKESPFSRGSWIDLINFEVKQGVCYAIDKYAGEFGFSLEQALGVAPRTCPFPKGIYHGNNIIVDLTKLRLPLVPSGKTKVTVQLHHKAKKQMVGCQVSTLSSF